MRDSIRNKLENLRDRLQELDGLLADAEVIAKQEQFRTLSIEHAELQPIVTCFNRYCYTEETLANAKEMMKDSDLEIRQWAEEEYQQALSQQTLLENDLQLLLLPKDPDDNNNVFLEIRAGTGGNEAALFAGDLARMYMRYAEQKNWPVEILNESLGEQGGYKEIIMRISGQCVYSQLKFESGGHRVQRVPETEAQGRIHTSACTVAVLPEISEVEQIQINPADLKVDTYRSSGAGGQHVNKTESAIRITHVPSGMVVECQDERSQHKNRARAMSLLQSRLLNIERERQQNERSATRRILVGSGDRSERIRTYNFPQGRVTDHRINLTLYRLNDVLQGNLNLLLEPLAREHQMDLLANLNEQVVS